MNYIEYFKIYITICNKNIISMKITRIFQDRTNILDFLKDASSNYYGNVSVFSEELKALERLN